MPFKKYSEKDLSHTWAPKISRGIMPCKSSGVLLKEYSWRDKLTIINLLILLTLISIKIMAFYLIFHSISMDRLLGNITKTIGDDAGDGYENIKMGAINRHFEPEDFAMCLNQLSILKKIRHNNETIRIAFVGDSTMRFLFESLTWVYFSSQHYCLIT